MPHTEVPVLLTVLGEMARSGWCMFRSALCIHRRWIGPSITQSRILQTEPSRKRRARHRLLHAKLGCPWKAKTPPLAVMGRSRSALPCEPGILELSLQDEALREGALSNSVKPMTDSDSKTDGRSRLWTCKMSSCRDAHCRFRCMFSLSCFRSALRLAKASRSRSRFRRRFVSMLLSVPPFAVWHVGFLNIEA